MARLILAGRSVSPPLTNRGYGSEIIRMLLEYLFTDEMTGPLDLLERIRWATMLENERARLVHAAKTGARMLGVREDAWQDQTGAWRLGRGSGT